MRKSPIFDDAKERVPLLSGRTGPAAIKAAAIDDPDTADARPTRVILVGAGPGDPDLLTLRAVRALQSADVILCDDLVDRAVLDHARGDAEIIDVGKRGGRPSWKQAEIHELILGQLGPGRIIVRLKGGDPFVFGRGGEEVAALRAAGLEVEVVPGITAAVAAAASTEVPLTHRDLARTVTFLSGAGPGHGLPDFTHIDLAALSDGKHTLAVYMGVRNAGALGNALMAAGWAADTPVLAVENASRAAERRVRGTVGDLAVRPEALSLVAPAVLIIGEVAGLPVAGVVEEIKALAAPADADADAVERARGRDASVLHSVDMRAARRATPSDEANTTRRDLAYA